MGEIRKDMEFSYTESTDTSTNMVTKDYSKSRMRENCKCGSVRGGQSNLIPSTRLRRFRLPLAGWFKGGWYRRCAAMSIYAATGGENRTTALTGEGKQANRPFGRWKCTPIPAARDFHLKVKRLTTFCASLCSYKMCSLCTPEGEVLETLCLQVLMKPKANLRTNLPPSGWQANVICKGA